MSAGWYVYAIVAHDRVLPAGLIGLAASELGSIVSGGLAAVTSRLAPGGLQLTTENVVRHGAIVEALRQRGPTLPVRFGTVMPDPEAVASALAERQAVLTADLARLGDKVEFGLTVLWDRPPDEDRGNASGALDGDRTEHGPGTRYLRARLAVSRRDEARRDVARALARELDAVLGPHVLDRKCSIAPTDRLAIRAAYLIEPARFDRCRRGIAEVRERHPELRVLVSGPWLPYSFVSREQGDEHAPLSRSLNAISRWLSASSQDGGQQAVSHSSPS